MMTAKVIQLRPHKPVADAHRDLVEVLRLVRSGAYGQSVIDLALSKIADQLYDYVETQEGR